MFSTQSGSVGRSEWSSANTLQFWWKEVWQGKWMSCRVQAQEGLWAVSGKRGQRQECWERRWRKLGGKIRLGDQSAERMGASKTGWLKKGEPSRSGLKRLWLWKGNSNQAWVYRHTSLLEEEKVKLIWAQIYKFLGFQFLCPVSSANNLIRYLGSDRFRDNKVLLVFHVAVLLYLR